MKVRLSRSKGGKVKIAYDDHNSKYTVLLEPMGNDTLESRFDSTGCITNQQLVKGRGVDSIAEDVVAGSKTTEEKYSDVLLQKECPKCGNTPLSRYLDTVPRQKEAPVMPFYVCGKCKAKGYCLTDEYLRSLVAGNRALFNEPELSELGKDENAFMRELRAYIIRIFASQRIMHIK